MARNKPGAAAGYEPLLRVNLRQASEGGALLYAVRAQWRVQPVSQRELLVLVHGFNNTQSQAEEVYLAFRGRQSGPVTDPRRAQLENLLGDAFWPGDADWPGLVDKIDFFCYSGAVAVARDAAPRIAEYLRSRRDVLTVHFVAHSLGCRVVLETIENLAANGGPKVGKVCLMAAAVPTFKVCPGGALFRAVNTPEYLRVLYSPADKVLTLAFPGGQTLAGRGEGVMPSAVGHAGDIPLSPGRVERDHIPGAGHGDYWGHQSTVASMLSAKSVADFMRFDGLAQRSLRSQPLAPARPMSPQRVVGKP